jgi:DNA-binding NarL/FixJ family response regulator
MIPSANSKKLSRKRIVIGGPRKPLLEGLREVSSRTCNVLTVSNNFVVIQQTVRLLSPDAAVIDAGTACWEIGSLIDRLASTSPALRILALIPDEQIRKSDESGDSTASRLTLLPASASEDLFHETLLRVIEDDPGGYTVAAGSPARPGSVSLDVLTPRQRDILRLICSAESTKGIARILNISTRTVEFHKYRMMKALDVTTVTELIVLGITSGLSGRAPQPLPSGEADASAGRRHWETARRNGNSHYRFLIR